MKNFSLPIKFGLLFILFMVPVVVVINTMYREQEKILTNQVSETLNELIEQNSLVLESEFDRIYQQTTSIILDDATQNMRTDDERQDYEVFQDISHLENLLTNQSITDRTGLRYQLVFPYDDLNYQYAYQVTNGNERNIMFHDREVTPNWYEKAITNNGRFSLEVIETSEGATVALTRAIKDLSHYPETLGVLVVSNIENLLEENLGNSVSYEVAPYLLNETGEIYFKGSGTNVDTPSSEIASYLSNENMLNYSTVTDEEIFIKESNENYNFSIAFRVPLDQLTEQQIALSNFAIVITLVYLLIASLIAYYIAKRYIIPLQRLTRYFRFYIPGSIALDFKEYEGKGEIGRLMVAVYNLSYRVNRAIKDKYQAQTKSKEIELNMLHEQINPHLLYNTLESIQWNSIRNEDFETAGMISDLSALLKIGLNKGKNLITIEEELVHVKAYIDLQRKRHDYRFTFENKVNKTLYTQKIPKIILQPLVENSIKYGIKNMGDEGKITIDGNRVGDSIIIVVSDNGFKEVDVDGLNRSISGPHSSNGVGIFNVDERLKHYYGNQYGLKFTRDNGVTKVIMVLPFKKGK